MKTILSTCNSCLMLLLLIFVMKPGTSLAWTPGLEEAAKSVASNEASEELEWFVYNHNKEINAMALENPKFEKAVYQKCQNKFFKMHVSNVEEAARKAGMKARITPPNKIDPQTGEYIFNPGTDTDVDVVPLDEGGTLDLKKIKEAEKNFQEMVRAKSEKAGYKPPEGKIDTDTDFLANPDYTSDADFAAISKHINENGGTAYSTREAAKTQLKMIANKPVTLDEATSFSSTMKDLATSKFNKADDLLDEANVVRKFNPARARELELQAQLYESQGSKYVERLQQVNNNLREQNGLPPAARDITGLDEAVDTINVARRGAATKTEAAIVKGLRKQGLQKATEDLINSLGDIAKADPSKASKIAKAIAKELSTLPPARQGSMIQQLENTFGARAAKDIVQETRALNQAAKTSSLAKAGGAAADAEKASKWARTKEAMGSKELTKFKVVMVAGSAILMAKTGYDISINNVKPTDTDWDWIRNMTANSLWYGSGIGTAFEQAEAEELERYAKEHAAGQDPTLRKHVTLTLLKTGTYMGRDAIVGMLYLPDAIAEALSWSWGEVTGTNKLNAYTEAQNEIAAVMQKMVLERKEFEKAFALVAKMGVHPEDAGPFLNCMCQECGGSLGGYFAPGVKGEYGSGPCMCKGPLTIWNTPIPSSSERELECYNSITAGNYAKDQAIFDKWRKQARDENAQSVVEELAAVHELAKDESTLSEAADLFNRIQDLLYPKDKQAIRDKIEPKLAARAHLEMEQGELDKAIATSTVANKVAGDSQNRKHPLNQLESWKKQWSAAKEKTFPEIYDYLDKGRMIKVENKLRLLHKYMVTPEGNSILPPSYKDPEYLALLDAYQKKKREYELVISNTWKDSERLVRERDPRSSVKLITGTLNNWEHPASTATSLQNEIKNRLALFVQSAEAQATMGDKYLASGDLAAALNEYGQSVNIQKDAAVQQKLDSLLGRKEKGREYRKAGDDYRQEKDIANAIESYKSSISQWPDSYLSSAIAQLEKQLAEQRDIPKKEAVAQTKKVQPAAATKPGGSVMSAGTLTGVAKSGDTSASPKVIAAAGVNGNTLELITVQLDPGLSKLIKLHITEASELTAKGRSDSARIGEVEFYAKGQKTAPSKVTATSVFSGGYSIEQVMDGNRQYGYIAVKAIGWASTQKSGGDDWLTFDFAEPVDISKVVITTAPTRPYRLHSFSVMKYGEQDSEQRAGAIDGTKNNLEQSKQAQEEEFNRLISEGYQQEQQGQLSKAIDVYKRALTIHADGKVTSHVHDLEQRIELEREKEKQFSFLIKDGYAKEKAGDLRSAIDQYREAVQIKSDVKVESHIHDMETKYKDYNRSQEMAKGQQRQEQQKIVEQTPVQPGSNTQTKKVTQENSTPWSGTYHSKESFAGGHTVQDVTLHLTQKGEQLSGQITLKLFTQGNPYSNDTSSVNGSCHGRTGTVVVNGESMKLNLSPDGNSLTDTDGLSLKRVK
ncbi:MAG: discoidin domain-containing protein [Proteobacteria bacterium]|nr:discoidin domain-containing protein [Pseudomonadota bacterium]MBU1057339.1 discoidin domain-containing protein [Pseudomonadota bacterium]